MAKDWVPSWLRRDEDKEDDKVELPKELKDSIEASMKSTLTPIEERLKGLDSLSAFAEEYRKDKEDARKAREAAEAAARARKEAEGKPSATDLAALMIDDPERAVSEITKEQQKLTWTIRADQIKDKVFRDRADEFPYYAGDIQKEIDTILESQSLQFRNDPVAVANTYYTVVGKKQKEINEGKIKSRFASSSSSSSTTGNARNPEDPLGLAETPEILKAARLSGMDIKDYMKILEKAAKAGEIEYV